jgi:hypothetical protein
MKILRIAALGTALAAVATGAALIVPRVAAHESAAEPETSVDLQLVAAHLPGFRAASVRSATDSSSHKIVTAHCPAGTVVVGGYGKIVNGEPPDPALADIADIAENPEGPFVKLIDTRPVKESNGRYGYTVGAMEIGSYAKKWYLVTVAYCATKPAGYEIFTQSMPRSVHASGYVSRPCGKGNVPLVVGGGLVAHTDADLATVNLVGFRVQTDPDARTGSNDMTVESRGSSAWGMHLDVVCSRPPAGYALARAVNVRSFIMTGDVAMATCPPGTRVYSMAARVADGTPTHLTGYAFDNKGTVPYAVAVPDRNATVKPGGLTMTAICAD